jgi:hypothetical protein
MTIGQKSLHIDGITWHCLSIFYSTQSVALLLSAIHDFFEKHKRLITHWSFLFSQRDGERVNVVFTSKESESDTVIELAEKYFERFLRENPSEEQPPIPQGAYLWMHYPNNSQLWNAFHIPSFLREDDNARDFSQLTSSLIVNLYDPESSYEENIVTIFTFLQVKLLKAQNAPLPKITDPDIEETIQSYWDYEEDGLLSEWMRHTDFEDALYVIRCHLNFVGEVIGLAK